MRNATYLRDAASLQTRSTAMAVQKAARKAKQGATLFHQALLLANDVPTRLGPINGGRTAFDEGITAGRILRE